MLTKTIVFRLLALVAVAAMWSVANAQRAEPSPTDEVVDGRVAEVDERERTVTLDVESPAETEAEAERVTFHIPEDAEIVLEGVNFDRPRTMSDLRVGQQLRVIYEEDENGDMNVRRLEG